MFRNKRVFVPLILVLLLVVTAIGCSTTPAPTTTVPATTTAPAKTTAPAPTTAPPKTTAPVPTSATPAPTTTTPASTTYQFFPKVGDAPASGIKYGGTMRIGISSDAVALGAPQMGKLSTDTIIANSILERLGNRDSEGGTQPWLAESWKEDYSTKTMMIYLRKGIRFQDGTDFNAEAVKWNLEMLKANKVSNAVRIDSVDIIDPYTIKITASTWVADFASNVLVCYMVSPTAWKVNGTEWGKQNPVGTGPFKMVSRMRDVSTKCVKNTDYWMKGKPYLDAIEFYVIADKTTKMASFQAGELDEIVDPSVAQAQELQKNPGKYVIWHLPGGLSSYALGPSPNDPKDPLSKLQVRQALGYAVDKQVLVDSVMPGFSSVATQQCPPGTWPYNPALKGYPYDVAKAKQLLAEAGYPDGFETTLTASSADSSEVLVSTALQGMLAKAGIKIKLNLLSAAAIQQVRTPGGWTGIMLSGMAPSPAAITLTISGTTQSQNRTFWVSFLKSSTLDAAVAEAMAATDMKTYQEKVWILMDMIYYKEAQLLPLYYADSILAKAKYVKNDNFYVTAAEKNSGSENIWFDR
jgi:peptide/nickel transport system substrate-binding protein